MTMRAWINIVEGVAEAREPLPPAEALEAIRGWFAQHGVEPTANLASPVAFTDLPNGSLRVTVRDWPDGGVDGMTRYLALRDAFRGYVRTLGWHVTMEEADQSFGQIGTVGHIKLQPDRTAAVEVPATLHHYTLAKNLPAILRDGLEPRSQRGWDAYLPRIHLVVPQANEAEWLLFQNLKLQGPPGEPWAKLAIDTRRVPEATFHVDPEAPSNGVWTYSTIPPEAIRVVSDSI